MLLEINTVFAKVFVREFFRLNSGFFILVITLTFGFMSGVEHRALAEFFTASPVLTLIPITLWIAYGLKVINFNHQRTLSVENLFLFNFSLLPRYARIAATSLFVTAQLVPVILYGIFLLLIGVQNGRLESIGLIVLSIITIILVSALIAMKSLQPPLRQRSPSTLKTLVDKHVTRPIGWMYITSTFRQEPFLILGTKIFTCVIIFAVQQLYQQEAYDIRLMAMVAALAGAGNFLIMMQVQQFDLKHLTLLKNLPIPVVKRFLIVLSVLIALLAPEIIVLLAHSPEFNFFELLSAILILPSLSALTYALLFINYKSENVFPRFIFGLALLHIILILFKFPIFILIGIDLLASYKIFTRKYYSCEAVGFQ